MKFRIDSRIIKSFPHIAIAVVQGRVTSYPGGIADRIAQLRQDAESQLDGMGLRSDRLTEHAHIQAWRSAYQAFGVKAKTHKPTHEALVRRLLRGEGWPSINPIVDIYLTNQAAHILPHGGYDRNTLIGALNLTISEGGEPFLALGGEQETTNPGEVIYRDDQQIVTRRWNYRDCETTKITPDTTEFILMIESPSELIALDAVKKAGDDLVRRLNTCLEGEFSATLLAPRETEQEFEL